MRVRFTGKNHPPPAKRCNPPDASSKFHNPSMDVILLNRSLEPRFTERRAWFSFCRRYPHRNDTSIPKRASYLFQGIPCLTIAAGKSNRLD